jgi:transposase
MGSNQPAFTRQTRRLGRDRQRQPSLHKRGALDTPHRIALARFAPGIRRLEQHASAFHTLARQGDLGKPPLKINQRTRLRVAYDGRNICESSFSRIRSGWRQRRHRPYKRGLNTKIHLAVDAHGMPVRILVTSGSEADCTHACELVSGIKAEHVIADKGYDSDKLIAEFEKSGMKICIPPRKNRKNRRTIDKHLYKIRHLVENTIQRLKEWRGIATRYAKRQASFYSAVCLKCAVMWASIS